MTIVAVMLLLMLVTPPLASWVLERRFRRGILREVGQDRGVLASVVAQRLGATELSTRRALAGLERDGLITTMPAHFDRRCWVLDQR